MKKILVSIFIVFCLISGAFAKTYNVKAKDDIVTLKKSDVIIVELSENASTGFQWEFSSTDENVAKIIDKKTVYPRPSRWKAPMCGQSGTAVYKIKAINQGNASIYGAYRRSWEKFPPLIEYKLNIVVE